MKRAFIIGIVIISSFLPSMASPLRDYFASGPDSFSGDSVRRIEEITVTTRRLDNSVIPAQMLTGEELRKLNVHSVADAIRYFSGVQIKDYGGIGGLKTVNIRSMGSHHVGVFYDGIQSGNAQNGVVDLGRFSLDNMEAVLLYNGQKSNIFQSAKDFASAGAVYMQTKVPVFYAGKTDNLKASVKTGSFATINPSAFWEHRLSNSITTSVSAEFLNTNGKYKFTTYSKKDGYDFSDTRRNGDVMMARAEAGLFGRINDGDWRAKAYYYNSQRGYPGASTKNPGRYVNEARQWDENFFFQGSFRKKFSDLYSTKINAKYARDYLHYYAEDTAHIYVNNHYRQQEIYFSSANELTFFEWWSANLSADFQYNKLNADLVNFAYPRRATALGAAATSIRLPRFSFQTSILYTYVTDRTKKNTYSAGDKNEWTPSAITSYKVLNSEDLFLRAFYKRIFRMPTLNDNYYTFIGNINLDPEYTNQYNIGAAYNKTFSRGRLQHLDLQLDVYYNEVENKIVAMPANNQFRWMMVNLGFVEIRGLDFAGAGNFRFGSVGLDTRLSYTYQKAQDFTDPTDDYYGGQIPYVPWHSGSFILGLDYRNWNINYSFIYTGERYVSQANIAENYSKPWYTHDLSVSKLFNFPKSRLRLTGEINNVFNQQYEVVLNYPMPGTNFKFIITLEL